jgi:1-acyl-sn-glycerol-3-phosphate acyltransferase
MSIPQVPPLVDLILSPLSFGQVWFELGRTIVSLYASLFLHLDIHYKTILPSGPKILVANHPSTIDPILLTLVVPEQTCILITERLFKVPIVGRSLRLTGHIEVLLENGRLALEEGLRFLARGRTLGVFPEGIISPAEGGCARHHTGAARLALQSGAPVIPVGIALESRRLWRRETTVRDLTDIAAWYFSGPYAVTVGEPVTFTGNIEDRECVHAVTDQIRALTNALSLESTRRVHATQARSLRKINPIEANILFKIMRFLLNPA